MENRKRLNQDFQDSRINRMNTMENNSDNPANSVNPDSDNNQSNHMNQKDHSADKWEVPEGWEVFEAGELFEFKNGINAGKESYGKGIKFINVMEVIYHDFITPDMIPGTVQISEEQKDLYLVKDGDVLFNRTSETIEEIGMSAVYNGKEDVVFGGFVIRGRSIINAIDSVYKRYCLRSNLVRNQIIKGGQGAVRTNIGQGDLSLVKIPLPPLPEQRAIAQVLSTADAAIHTTEKLIAQKELRKKWLMQQLLTGKKRLNLDLFDLPDDHDSASTEKSSKSDNPENHGADKGKRLKGFEGEWKEMHLGEMFTERNENKYFDLPLLSIGQNGVYPQDESVKKDTSNEDKSKYKRICPSDIGYNTMRMWQGRSALSDLEGIVSPAYTVVTPKKNADSIFFSYLFKMPKMTNLFWRNSQGLVDDTLNCKFKDFSIVKVMLPQTKEEQTAIARVLQAADKEISLLKAKAEKLQEQKKGLMQQLLTGKKRLIV